MTYLTTLLSQTHQKEKFSCGKEMLDSYIHRQAGQDMKKKVATCFVLSADQKTIKGYYTLSTGSIPRSQIPESISKKLSKYEEMPVILLGRLAVDANFRGQGLGGDLLIDALKRSFDIAATAIGAIAVVVDPLDDDARAFYGHYGFISLPDSGRMFLVMKTIEGLFG
jgi:GNAT superfamily N-acetyltransferase